MAKKSPESTIPERKLKLYTTLVETIGGLEVKGAKMPYTSVNGNMFSFLTPEGELVLRLPKEEREEFITKYKTKLAEQHGTVLKEYVLVPDKEFAKMNAIKKFMAVSYEYACTFKSKKK